MNSIIEPVLCADCGMVCTPGGCTTSYAMTMDNLKICFACADKAQREDLKDRSKPFCAYLDTVKQQIVTWTGGKLMTVTKLRPCQLTRQSFMHDRRGYCSVHAVDVHGGHWSGRGSNGIVIRMRPVKS